MSLQEEIDAAAPGSEVVVPSGVHPEVITLTKPLTLRGQPGATLDAGQRTSVVRIDVPPGAPVRLIGLTLKNGAAQGGGGVAINRGVVELEDCVITGCHAPAFGGGGIYSTGQLLRLTRCRIEDNRGRQGGGLFLDGSVQATVTDSLIARNGALWGGAVRVRDGAKVVLERCTLADNVVVGEEAAGTQLYLSGTTTRQPKLDLHNCIVAGAEPLLFSHPEHPGTIGGSHVLASAKGLPSTIRELRVAAPAFSGDDADPYRPGPSSPANGAADLTALPAGARDLAGTPRNSPGGMDLGAYSRLR